jgi:hypothetical protein
MNGWVRTWRSRLLLSVFTGVQLWFLFPAPAAAQDAGDAATTSAPPTAVGGRSAAAAIDPTRVPLGRRAHYTLTIRHPKGDRVQLPPRGTNPFGAFQAVGVPTQGSKDEGLVVADTYVFDLVALDVGATRIPLLAVSLVSPEGRAYELAAPAVSVEVVDPGANEPLADVKMRGAKGADGKVNPVRPYAVYVRDWTLAIVLAVIGGLLVVALLAVLLTRLYMKRRRGAVAEGPPPVPPYPVVRERLAHLRVPGAYARMGAKAFHVEVAEAVKEYLGRRHDIEALEMTSVELLDAIDRLPMGGVTRVQMEMFLANCDIVKFARGEPTEAEALDVLGTAEGIVEQVERAMVEVDMKRAAEAAAKAAAEAAARAAAEAAQRPPGQEPPAQAPPVRSPPVPPPPAQAPPTEAR